MPAVALLLGWASAAWAGPPFITDDPQPTDTGHWEVYGYALGSNAHGVTAGEAGFDINYGAYKNLQLTVVLPVDYATGAETRGGLGDVELAAKYKFLHQRDGDWTPDVSFFPRVFAPAAGRHLGAGRWSLLLPVWAQKDFGPWSVFGGGGYQINPGPEQKNFWVSGLAVQRAVNDRLSLGAEVYHQTADETDARAYTLVNVGVTYKLVQHWSLLAAGGPSVQNARDGGNYNFYLALLAAY